MRIIGSPVQAIRACFDLMAYDTDDDWEIVAQRMARVPDALASLEASLREGMARGIVAARRQALACADQAATWSGDAPVLPQRSPPGTPATRASPTPRKPRPTPYARLAAFLRDEYAPVADPRDPVGRERYALFARAFNGIELDLDETYQWGWEELYRIEDAMRRVAERILPGATARRGDRAPRPRPEPLDRRRRRVPALEPGRSSTRRSPSSTARTSTSPSRCTGAKR